MPMTTLDRRYNEVRENITSACERSNRDPENISLVAVTKGFDKEVIRRALRKELFHIGENRVGEYLDKREALGELEQPVRWHFIGHLQSNKVRKIVGEFDLLHSVDRTSLINELEKRGSRNEITQDVLIQVNTSGESSKHGVSAEESPSILESMLETSYLRVRGLMTMAPWTDNKTVLRNTFSDCRELRNRLSEHHGTARSSIIWRSPGLGIVISVYYSLGLSFPEFIV
ncbi:MAG: YggS family pyridoxal phosphate-dependent enzyme [bacterium]